MHSCECSNTDHAPKLCGEPGVFALHQPMYDGELATTVDNKYLTRLEKLVRLFIGRRFTSADDLWNLQMELLDLQREIQVSITATKSAARVRKPSSELEMLRYLRFQARRFGDAFAWTMLRLDRQLIHPLGENQRVPTPPDDDGAKGMLALGSILAQKGWGFPLLHDITDCLRIGDMTFIKPDNDPVTVEVKSRVVSDELTDGGTRELTYQASVISAAEPPDIREATERVPKSTADAPTPTFDDRAERQFQRLGSALAHQTAKSGSIRDIDGKALVTTEVNQGPSHFHEVQRIARKARRNGFASVALEDAFLYVAIYDENGLSADRLGDAFSHVSEQLMTSGILDEETPDLNSLLILSMPDDPALNAKYHIPYFLFDLPQSTRIDMLRRRMILLNIVNAGRVSMAIEEAGYNVRHPTGRNDLGGESLVVSASVEDEGGRSYLVELHSLQRHIEQMILEFQPLSYLLNVIDGMREASALAMQQAS